MNPVRAQIYSVLFVCTANSARSIMAEGLLNCLGGPRFRAYSAGSHANGKVNPMALATLAHLRIACDGLRSKSWDEFAINGAQELDFVFTVCDRAAGEVCPIWPGQPIAAHWGVPDPASVQGSCDEQARAFMNTAVTLMRRIEAFLKLPLDELSPLALQRQLTETGRLHGADVEPGVRPATAWGLDSVQH